MSFYGFRRWRVSETGQLLPLSFRHASAWRRGQHQPPSSCLCFTRYHILELVGRQEAAACHAYPQASAGRCGYYLHRAPILPCFCLENTDARHGAVGVVRGWGRHVEHEEGWRCQYAEIIGLVDFTGHVDQGYTGARYPDLPTMYAEWAPGSTVWATDEVDWCGQLGPPGQTGGLLYGSQGFQWAPVPWITVYGGPIPRQGPWADMIGFGALLRTNLANTLENALATVPGPN